MKDLDLTKKDSQRRKSINIMCSEPKDDKEFLKLVENIDALAKKEYRSRAKVVRKILTEYFENNKR